MIGILAYGSLIDDPGDEIKPLITQTIDNVATPFPVEFARSSRTRSGAPTLVPVSGFGSPVSARILVLNATVSRSQAKDMLWRREVRKDDDSRGYDPPPNPGPNTVLIKELNNFEGLETVICASIAPNIQNLTARRLAELAIDSARGRAGASGRDGISYLIAAKRHWIRTPLMPSYENEILRITGAKTLESALEGLLGSKAD